MRLAIVGDQSFGDPNRLAAVLDAALGSADFVVQVGDLHPGYAVVAERLATGKLLVVPGNHDTEWSTQLSQLPRQWIRELPEVRLIGLDNSGDIIDQKDWDILNAVPVDGKPTFVFVHKPLSTLVLPDGTESNHIMGEGSPNASAVQLRDWVRKNGATMCCGHYHGWTYMKAPYGDVILDGRGGAASQLGYTLINIYKEGWIFHPVNI